ncbi:hypothetical protein OF83DRAFT_1099871 [Amylostereum chailletii]|nr:hypothetical protein OF83DRAFT_1099871 [Amylostereum chailletii]
MNSSLEDDLGVSTGAENHNGGPTNAGEVCLKCGKQFARKYDVTRHVREVHKKDKPHKCHTRGCGKTFSRFDRFRRHVVLVHGGTLATQHYRVPSLRHRCPFRSCNLRFSREIEFQSHIRSAHPGRTVHKCPMCPCYVLRQDGLRKHLLRHEREAAGPLESPESVKEVKVERDNEAGPSSYNGTLPAANNSGDDEGKGGRDRDDPLPTSSAFLARGLVCPFPSCRRSFGRVCDLSRHKRAIHGEEQQFVCPT